MSGVALAMRHRLIVISTYELIGLRKGDEPEYYNGGRRVEGERSGEGAVPSPEKKLNFYLK